MINITADIAAADSSRRRHPPGHIGPCVIRGDVVGILAAAHQRTMDDPVLRRNRADFLTKMMNEKEN